MAGGNGNDTYVVDNAGDQVTEAAGEGVDTVQSAVNLCARRQRREADADGQRRPDGTGNGLANTLVGIPGYNILNGGARRQHAGGGGNDTYVVDNAGDVASRSANAGVDLVQSSVSYSLPPTSRS